MTAPSPATITRRNGYSLDADLRPIIEGKVALPNAEPIQSDVGSSILHYREMHCGTAVLPGGKKEWNARFFLDYGQGGGLHGSGIVLYWQNSKGVAASFAICDHKPVEGGGANHSRGWHPASCSKCGLDMSVDSGD
jgi:hypothetical protein